MSRIIGIDLGTTNSVAAAMQNGVPVVIPSAEGENLFPSIVAIDRKTGERLVGLAAKNQASINPENTIFSIKRFLGRKFSDPEVQSLIQRMPYRFSSAPNGDVRVRLGDKEYVPQEILAMILQKIKIDSEEYLSEDIDGAIITVPAYFNDNQRRAIKDASRIAGLEVVQLINESTASSLVWWFGKDKKQNIAVYDLGGGTFNISILELGDGVFEVRSTGGDTYLGGDDLDQSIVLWINNHFQEEHNIDLLHDPQALLRLKEAAEKAKRQLSTTVTADIELPYIWADIKGSKHLNLTLTRANLDEMAKNLIERTVSVCEAALRDAGLRPYEISTVLLTGGMTRMPFVQQTINKVFGIADLQGFGLKEIVALGAAIQAGSKSGDVKNFLLLDVISLSLGIETIGGVFATLIERNTTIPTKKSQVFSTSADGQTQVEIHLLQGERPLATHNKSLGKLILDSIPPQPRGVPQIEVTIDIDWNGLINISATDKATGRAQKTIIKAYSGLSEAEIEHMTQNAEKNLVQDAQRKVLKIVNNKAEIGILAAEKLLREEEGKLSEDIKRLINLHITSVIEAQRTGDTNKIETATDSMMQFLATFNVH